MYQNELSRSLKEDIIKQSFELQSKYRIKVHVLHEIFNYPGGWTIHNLIPQLMLYQHKSHMDNINTNTNTNTNRNMNTNTNTNTNQQFEMKIETETGESNGKSKREDIITNNTRWIVFCEDTTKVKVKLLMERLNNENHTQVKYFLSIQLIEQFFIFYFLFLFANDGKYYGLLTLTLLLYL